jgi:hypothetical protein
MKKEEATGKQRCRGERREIGWVGDEKDEEIQEKKEKLTKKKYKEI